MTNKSTYAQILKSSSLMGGSAIVTSLLGIVRMKFAAIFIGINGLGLLASYLSIQGLMVTIAGLGLQSGGVRDIAAEMARDGDRCVIGRILFSLQRISWVSGLVSMLTMIIFSALISNYTYGSNIHSIGIACLGATAFLLNLSIAPMALLQGMQRIGDMARLNVYVALISTVAAIILYLSLGVDGIIPSILVAAFAQLLLANYFSRRIQIPKIRLTWSQTLAEINQIIRLGLAFMGSAILNSALSYITVAIILGQFNTEMVGIYSAAFVLSGVLVNFVLLAMGADYYPRLTKVVQDPTLAAKVINEQTQVGVLLALPGVLASYIFAPLLLFIAYSNQFTSAESILQIYLIGVFIKVISWPLGFVVLALGESILFFTIEFLLMMVQVALITIGIKSHGLSAVAWAFTGTALLNFFIEFYIARKRLNFKYSFESIKIFIVAAIGLMLAILFVEIFGINQLYFVGFVIVLTSIGFCFKSLTARLESNHPINIIRKKLFSSKSLENR